MNANSALFFCVYITSCWMTVAGSQCKDILNHCSSYTLSTACKGEYTAWAKQNCMKTCGFCGKPAPTPKPTVPPSPHKDKCTDALPNCKNYNIKTACVGEYAGWAIDNCKKTCGYCSQAVPTVKPKETECKDVKFDCKTYDLKIGCTGKYASWALHNCKKSCGLCKQSGHTPVPKVNTPRPDITPAHLGRACKDILNNCHSYNLKTACVGEYEDWAKQNCMLTCGHCDRRAP